MNVIYKLFDFDEDEIHDLSDIQSCVLTPEILEEIREERAKELERQEFPWWFRPFVR